MKLLEISLFIVTCLVVYGYVFGLWTNTKRGVALVILGLVFFVPHAMLEGLRFQLIPLYVVLVFLGVVVISRLVKKNTELDFKPCFWKRVLAGCIGTFLLTAALMVPLYFFPILKIPEPTGPYTVGVTNYHWVDKNREETYADPPVEHRELMVRVWYPAELTKEARKAPYALDSETIRIVGNKLPLEYRMLLYSWLHAENHSYTDVPMANENQQYPVLVFSPGFGFSPYMYASQMEELASNGYIVYGIDHPYHTEVPTVFPGGRIAEGNMSLPEETEGIDQEIIVWVEDVLFAIEQINELNEYDPQGLMTGRLDVSRMGMFGHSLGGATTAQVMHLEPQIIAGVNMDGFFYGSVIEEGLAHPIMLLTGSEEMILLDENGDPVAEADYPQWAIDFIDEERKRKEGALKNNGVKVVLEDADHLSFSDAMLYSPFLDLAKYDPALLAKINQALLEYFDKHVKEVRP
jgi:predicted dienelactone hydrolase